MGLFGDEGNRPACFDLKVAVMGEMLVDVVDRSRDNEKLSEALYGGVL